MVDPVTILISLAPFILDLLFGEGHRMKHRKINPTDNKMDKALLMSGGAYPKRKDYPNDEEFIKAYAEEYIKRSAKATSNPWILFLEKKGFFDELKRLKDEYEKLKEEKGIKKPKTGKIPEPLLDHYLKLKSTEVNKLKAAKDMLEKINERDPDAIKKFIELIKTEQQKAFKMGFTNDDINKAFDRVYTNVRDAYEIAKKEYEKYNPEVGTGRVSYKTMAKELARKYGFRLPRSARQHGKTWKEIYMDLTTGLK
jgi:uncharacterized protein YaaW (UPF0174 family)